jgi:hypothetical protein
MSGIAALMLLLVTGCGTLLKPQPRAPDTATMVFYREFNSAIIVIVDGFPLDSWPAGEVTRQRVPPGEHTLWVKSQGLFGVPAAIRLAPAEVAYFTYRFATRDFLQVDEKQFEDMIALDVERRPRRDVDK